MLFEFTEILRLVLLNLKVSVQSRAKIARRNGVGKIESNIAKVYSTLKMNIYEAFRRFLFLSN